MSEDQITCRNCQSDVRRELATGIPYCCHCGYSLDEHSPKRESPICPRCGAKLPDDSTERCPQCGSETFESPPREVWTRYFRIAFFGTPTLCVGTAFADQIWKKLFPPGSVAQFPGPPINSMLAVGILFSGTLISAFLLTKARSKRGFDLILVLGYSVPLFIFQLAIVLAICISLSLFLSD